MPLMAALDATVSRAARIVATSGKRAEERDARSTVAAAIRATRLRQAVCYFRRVRAFCAYAVTTSRVKEACARASEASDSIGSELPTCS